MQHQEAVETIANLSDELSSGDPAKVIIKHASEHGYSPAIVQKLGQVYNMGLTINTLTKEAAKRGAQVPLLDTVKLVEDYIQLDNPVEKKAAVVVDATHDAGTVNLTRIFEDIASGKFGEDDEAVEKAAAMVTVESPKTVTITEDDLETLHDLEFEARLTCEKTASDILTSLERRYAGMSAEFDVSDDMDEITLAHGPGFADEAKKYIEKFASLQRIKRTILPYSNEGKTLYKRAFHRVTSDVATGLIKLAEELRYIEEIQKAASPSPVEQALLYDKDEEEKAKLEAMAEMLTPEDLENFEKEEEGDTSVHSEPAEESKEESKGGDEWDSLVDSAKEKKDPDEEKPKADSIDAAAEDAKESLDESHEPPVSSNESAKSKAKEESKGKSHTDRIKDIVGAGASAASTAIGKAIALPADILSSVLSEDRSNTAQRDLDRELANIERTNVVRRLMLTDPVLRQMKPAQVVSMYNSIVAANPEAAEDPNLMKLALREAVSYEGLTTDAYKQLVDTRKTKIQGDSAADSLENDRYRIKAQVPSKKQL